MISEITEEHFVFFRPRDIVSGDFYWVKQSEDKTFIIAADCTGHGVPGAFMSMLGVAFLNEITNKIECNTSASILNELRTKVKVTLSQSEAEHATADGMDLSLIILDNDCTHMQFSGAYNHLFFIRDGELEVLKADKMPIGKYHSIERTFTMAEKRLKKNDVIYMFSDGYRDQFGGIDNSKFGTRRFKELLLTNHKRPMSEQYNILKKTLKVWQGDKEQIDDILVVGLKI